MIIGHDPAYRQALGRDYFTINKMGFKGKKSVQERDIEENRDDVGKYIDDYDRYKNDIVKYRNNIAKYRNDTGKY